MRAAPETTDGQRRLHYGELLLSGALLVVLLVIAAMLLVLVKAENRQEKILLDRNAIFHRMELRAAIYYNSKAAQLTPEERAQIKELNRQAGIDLGQ